MSRKAPVVLCMGDSLTEGYHMQFSNVYTPYGQRLQVLLDMERRKRENAKEDPLPKVRVEIHGVCGETTIEIKRRMERAVAEYKDIRCVLILGGTNDIGTNVPPEDIEKHLMGMYTLAHERGIPAVAMTLPSCTSPKDWWVRKQSGANGIIRSLVQKMRGEGARIALVELSHIAEGRVKPLMNAEGVVPLHDHLHLAPSDYEEIADLCYPSVVAALAGDSSPFLPGG